MDSEYATNDFIEKMYQRYTEENELERIEHRSKFRQMKFKFCEENLKLLNSRVPSDKKYKFALQNNHSTKNKLYVALTRARRNIFFISYKKLQDI